MGATQRHPRREHREVPRQSRCLQRGRLLRRQAPSAAHHAADPVRRAHRGERRRPRRSRRSTTRSSSRPRSQADVDESGTVLVSGRLLAEIASRLPNAPCSRVDRGRRHRPSAAVPRASPCSSMPVEEYPRSPRSPASPGVVPAEDFATAVAQVAVAASRDDVTPVITGVQLEVARQQPEPRRDRPLPRRRARDPVGWRRRRERGHRTALVPARTLHGGRQDLRPHAAPSRSRSPAATTASSSRSAPTSKTVTSLLIKGNFPPVRRLFPETVDNYAVMNTAELIEATRRVSLVLEREAALRFTSPTDG